MICIVTSPNDEAYSTSITEDINDTRTLDDESASSSSSSSSLKSLSNLPKTNLPTTSRCLETLQSIDEVITRLHRLSIAIRRSAGHRRNIRAAKYVERSETGANLSEEFDQYSEWIIRHKYPQAKPEVSQRMSATIAIRRRRLLYQRKHQKKLALVPSKVLEQIPVSTNIDKSYPHLSDPVGRLLVPKGLAIRTNPEPPLTWTSASTIDANRSLNLVTRSEVSDLRSRSIVQNSKLDFPSPPHITIGNKEFECPYCCLVLPAREATDKVRWKLVYVLVASPFSVAN